MKSLQILASFILVALGVSLAVDYQAAPKYSTSASGSQVKMKTTESGGFHTAHVILDSGTVTLPTGAATAAKQDTGNTSLATIATNTTTAERTPTITTASSSGTVSAGARKLTFIFSADFSGTVLGAAFEGATDTAITIDAPSGDTLAAVAYTRSAGSVRIVKVQ